jgi:hypothetical protein
MDWKEEEIAACGIGTKAVVWEGWEILNYSSFASSFYTSTFDCE